MEDDFLNVSMLSDEEADKFFMSSAEVVEESKETEESELSEEQEVSEIDNNVSDEEGGEDEDIQEIENSTSEVMGSPSKASSIAQALQEVGVLQTLDKEKINSIQTAEDFADAIEEEVFNRLAEHNKRIDEALKYKVPIPIVQQYEQTIQTLESITEEMLEDESNENYRKNIIYQDLVNKGHSEEDAKEMVQDYVENGKDVTKAKKALESCKTFYKNNYESLIKEKQIEYKENQRMIKERSEKLKKSILEDKELFQDLNINKSTRQQIYDTVSKPIETLEDGTKITALQKYIKENPIDFHKNVGMLYVLTDGFTNINKFIKGPVKKEVKKGIDRLTNVLNNTSMNDGSLSFKAGISPNKKMSLDLNEWTLK
jgi:hypothetical protein